MLAFDKSEYLARIACTKERMAARGIDVLLATDPANMNYLTGYDGWSFYTPQAVIIAQTRDEPRAFFAQLQGFGLAQFGSVETAGTANPPEVA